jgi:hypothetical protein
MRFGCEQAPQGSRSCFFVGASLLANGGGQRVLPQAKIRWQASSYKGKNLVLVFVGASLLAKGGG